MKLRVIIIVLSILVGITPLLAQDNTFELEEAFRLDPGENSLFNRLVLADMNENGIDEIITSISPVPWSVNHRLTIIENREITYQGERFAGICTPPFIVDYNRDGVDDIAYENSQAAEDGQMFFLIHYGPEFEREVWGAGYFGTDRLRRGGNRRYEDGTTNPFFTHNETARFRFNDDNGPDLSINWKVQRMTEGTHEDEDGPQFVVDICRSRNFTVKEIDNRTVYFASGYNDLRRDETFQELIELVYYQMFTNYNSEFESPDSLTLFNRIDWPDYGDTSNICQHSLISDLDADGTLEWIQPWWHQTPVDTFQIHLPIVDAETMEISETFTEQITDIDFEWSPSPIMGIEAVDINGDDRMEILLVLQNHPIQIIDSESLEIILESADFVYPNYISYYCDIGHFDDTGRLQLIFRDEETFEFVIYNLPEGWQGEPLGNANFTINLHRGWNLVSSPFIPEEDDLESIFASPVERDNLVLVKDYLGRFYFPARNFNNIPAWDVNQGYQIKMIRDDRLLINGEEVAPDRLIPLPENWSMVAYFPDEPVEVQTGFANIADQLLLAKDGDGHFYVPQFEFNNIPPLHRGAGYKVKVSEEVELVWSVEGN